MERRAHSVEETKENSCKLMLHAKYSVDGGMWYVAEFGFLSAKRYPLSAKTKGAIGFDREERIKKACRGTAYPLTSGTKHNCRLF